MNGVSGKPKHKSYKVNQLPLKGEPFSTYYLIISPKIAEQYLSDENGDFIKIVSEEKYFKKTVQSSSFLYTIPYSEHKINNISNVIILDSTGRSVDISFIINGSDITVESNIDLINSTIIIK